jgi:hypothetical protein
MTAKTKINILKVTAVIMIINTIVSIATGLFIETVVSIGIALFNYYLIRDISKNPDEY